MLTFRNTMYRTPFLLVFALLTLALVGCQDDQRAASIERIDGVTIAFFIASDEPGPDLEEYLVRDDDRTLYLPSQPFLMQQHVQRAEIAESDYGNGLRLLLNDDGRQRLFEMTSANIGSPLAIAINGEVISTPLIREAMDTGQVLVTGSLGSEEIEWVAASINAGSPGD